MSHLVESHRGLGQIEFEGQRLPVRYLYMVSSEQGVPTVEARPAASPADPADTSAAGALWLLGEGNLAKGGDAILRERDGRALTISLKSCSLMGGTASYSVTGLA